MPSIYCYVGAGALSGLVLWLGGMLLLRHRVWPTATNRTDSIAGTESGEIKYHNEAIYRDFEYFFKVTLALLGGIAFVATRPEPLQAKIISVMLSSAASLQLIAGAVFSLFIFFHQKSKIERWKNRFAWWKPLTWLECWMVVTVLIRLSPNLKTAGCFSVESGTAPLISTPCGAAIQGIAAKSAIKWDCSRALGDNRISTVGTILAEEVIDELRARLM